MKKFSIALILSALCLSTSAFAQQAYEDTADNAAVAATDSKENEIKNEDDRTLEQKLPARITGSAQDNVLTVVVENDLFAGEDSNYTSGVRLTYLDVSSDFPEFAKKLDGILPIFEINDTSSLFYSVGQNLFTPADITQSVQDPTDRPWAAFLYGSLGMATFVDNHTDEVELTLGVVGPAALGEETQSFIHRYISNSPDPKGWDNQLSNEPALMLAWQRTWPQYIAGDIGPLFGSIAPYGGVTVGNVYTYGDVGFNVRIGPGSEKWQDAPVRVRPAMPGTGFFEIPEKKWSWYLFGGVEGRAVARNIFLDGNTFTDSYSVDKNWLVGDANAGLAITYDKIRVSFTGVYRTKEFETQDKPETFGAVSVGYRF